MVGTLLNLPGIRSVSVFCPFSVHACLFVVMRRYLQVVDRLADDSKSPA